ncbi:hypothetical protein OCH239_08330 [Roseivivax halodurans JCM 10272]|uniref:Uncharacterized protein n=1 Tax=Roseivivax halodurans JCM 10272 TaxID=1449350 RepID=X7EJH3_9RHOB|nr:hypothetical protein [Roseivivax halodurans]ETX16259.1 hypothetical protein OCH239_08330 [Roseivivax halodurans JCM 10272]
MLRLALILLPLHVPVAAFATGPSDPGSAFARCEGRLAANVEFGWLFGEHDQDADALRLTFSDLGQATGPAGSRARRDSRIRAKSDQARLLSDARFASDDRRRRIAAATADAHLRRCRALVLG